MDPPTPSVAIIDIGSNSIKLLVVRRMLKGRLHGLYSRTLDVRISAGISRTPPRLSEEGMAAGVAAVCSLKEDIRPFRSVATRIVATSAVRDAVNGADFCSRIKSATGLEVAVLSGNEEATLVGRGLLTDPAVASFRDFYLFDLGGGSLECLCFRERTVTQSLSLPLGCVRLTEKHVDDTRAPFGAREHAAVVDNVVSTLRSSSFAFDLGEGADALFIGGTMTTARFMLAANAGIPPDSAPTQIPVSDLRSLYTRVASLALQERKRLPALRPERADVLPAALLTTLTVADLGSIQVFHTSSHNLRWGIADRMLPVR